MWPDEGKLLALRRRHMADHHGAFDTSVCEKSLPLKRSGSPEVRARAYEKQSPKFHGRRLAALAVRAEGLTAVIHLVRSHQRRSESLLCTTTDPVLCRRCRHTVPQPQSPFRGPRRPRSGERDRRRSRLRGGSASGSLARMAMNTEESMTISAAALGHRNRGFRRHCERPRPDTAASFADSAEFVARAWTSGLSALPRQALAQGVEYSFSQGFAGRGGELARQSVGLRVFDA